MDLLGTVLLLREGLHRPRAALERMGETQSQRLKALAGVKLS